MWIKHRKDVKFVEKVLMFSNKYSSNGKLEQNVLFLRKF